MKAKLGIAAVAIFLIAGFLFFDQSTEPVLTISVEGSTFDIDPEYIYSLADSETFPSVVRSSGEKPVETEYRGIELSRLLEDLDIELKEQIIFNAEDGYRIVLSSEEIIEPRNVYLAYERDGEKLKSRKQGGNGPYQLIIRRDPFSQRWIKHVNEIIVSE